MANNWYSFREMMVEPTAKMCELFYHGDARGAWEAGKYSADFGLTGFYKIFVKVGSPDFILKRASTIMAGYYSPCQLGVIRKRPRQSNRAHHPVPRAVGAGRGEDCRVDTAGPRDSRL